MGKLPTSEYAKVLFAALFGIAVIAGCATSNGDADFDPTTPAEGSNNNTPAKKKNETPAPAPTFNPAFEPTADAGADATNTTAGEQCIDTDDPGGAENVAKLLPDTDDCDNDLKEVSGVMKGAVDVDFYKISGADKFGCSLDTEFSGSTTGTELCVYARCKNSTVDAVTGCEGGTLKTSTIGMKGCCAAAPGNATPQWDCSGLTDNDSADFYVSVKQINNGDKCLPYKFKYRF